MEEQTDKRKSIPFRYYKKTEQQLKEIQAKKRVKNRYWPQRNSFNTILTEGVELLHEKVMSKKKGPVRTDIILDP